MLFEAVNNLKIEIAHTGITFKNMLGRTFLLVFTLLFSPILFGEPFWGSKASQSVDTELSNLKPGQFIWKGDAVPFGPMRAEVRIAEQKIYLYRNGVLIGVSTISTGRFRRSTPTGVFTVRRKNRHYRSRKYDNAPMPYAQWLTSNIAMHAGKLPGYPASHGCIRLPTRFARLLFESTSVGMPVAISRRTVFDTSHFSAMLAVNSHAENLSNTPALSPAEKFRWQPQLSGQGAVSIVMDKTNRYILVYRNGIEIGRAKLSAAQPEKALGTHAYIMQKGEVAGINPFLQDAPPQRWIEVELPGYNTKEGMMLDSSVFQQPGIPLDFAKALNSILTQGTTLLITDAPISAQVPQNAINHKKTQDSEHHNIPLQPNKPATAKISVELELLNTEIQKSQATVDRIKKDLANIEKQQPK